MIEKLKKSMGTDGRSRGLTKKLVALLAFGSIILVFVFMDMAPETMGVSGGGVVAQVNNVSISLGQFRSQVEQMEQRFGGANPAFSQFIRQQAMENLIDQEVLFQSSQEEGLLVSEEEIRDVIFTYEVFQENGRFSPVRYQAALRGARLSPAQFEADIRKNAATNRLRRLMSETLVPTAGELQLQQKAKAMRQNLDFVAFRREELAEKMAKEVKYDGVVSEQMKEKVENHYKMNIADYSDQEEVKAQHILIKMEERSEKEALDKINELAEKAKSGGDFAALAKEHSEDAGSAKSGGDLGFFGRGRMVPAFEEAVFAMNVGDVSEPVKSQFGYHLIRLNEKKEAKVKELDEVRDEVTKKVMAMEQVDKDVEQLEQALAAREMAAVSSFVKEHQLAWKATGDFDVLSDQVPQIGSSDELMAAAFQLDSKSRYPEKVFRVSGKSYLIRYKAPSKAAAATEEPVDDLSNQLASSQANDAFLRLRNQWKDSAEIYRNRRYLDDGR